MKTQRCLIVVPAWNESGKIERVVQSIRAKNAVLGVELAPCVVDDCSTDDTAMRARTAGAVVISQRTNLGVGAAIRAGIDYALANGYEFAAVMSGDDQHNAGDLEGLLLPLVQGRADLVQGSRWVAGGNVVSAPLHRRLLTRLHPFLFLLATGTRLSDTTNGMRAFPPGLFRERGINLWQDWLDRYELEVYMLYQCARKKCRVVEAPVTIRYSPKRSESTKMKWGDWWRMLRPILLLRLGIKR
jgi:dolichol-phosphate mannosyltransferase